MAQAWHSSFQAAGGPMGNKTHPLIHRCCYELLMASWTFLVLLKHSAGTIC